MLQVKMEVYVSPSSFHVGTTFSSGVPPTFVNLKVPDILVAPEWPPITTREISSLIQRLKCCKAPNPDVCPALLFKANLLVS